MQGIDDILLLIACLFALVTTICGLLSMLYRHKDVSKWTEATVFYGAGVISQLNKDAPPPLHLGSHQPPARSGSGQGRESG